MGAGQPEHQQTASATRGKTCSLMMSGVMFTRDGYLTYLADDQEDGHIALFREISRDFLLPLNGNSSHQQ